MNTYDVNSDAPGLMSEDERHKEEIQTHRWRDLGYDGKQDPDDTLTNERSH
jgi:hypothetical protein